MHIETLTQLFSLAEPWSLGRRDSITEPEEVTKDAPLAEFPYYACRGVPGNQFRVVGSTLQECAENVLLARPAELVVAAEPNSITETVIASQKLSEIKE